MKATEIQIGDWVNTDKFKLLRVVSIDGGTNTCWVDSTERSALYGTDAIYPIPLTPEILEKNGFEFVSVSTITISSTKLLDIHTSIHFQFINGKSAFVRLHHCGAGSYEFSKHIQSVHDLQHALRLCGLDELADNFKVI